MSMMVNSYRFAGGGTPVDAATLIIASGKVSADIANFPVCVDLSGMGATFWNYVASDGSDIEVYQGATQLARDLIYFDYIGSAGILAFKAPSIASAANNDFVIKVGSGNAAPPDGSTYGRNNTWSNFHRVIHGRQIAERTGSGVTITNSGVVSSGGVLDLLGADTEYLRVPTDDATSWTMIGIGYLESVGPGVGHNSMIMSYTPWTADNTKGEPLGYSTATGTAGSWNSTNGWIRAGAMGAGNTYSLAVSHVNGGNRILYLDGSNVATAGSAADRPAASPELLIGNSRSDLTETWEGTITLAALAHSELSAAFIKGMHDTWRSPATFYSVS